jgi:3-hydroxybutyrate dehydrogenase
MKPLPPARALRSVADVADQAAVNAAIAEAAARQPIDILIANAGAAESAPFGKIRCGAVPAHDGRQFHGRGHAVAGGAAR